MADTKSYFDSWVSEFCTEDWIATDKKKIKNKYTKRPQTSEMYFPKQTFNKHRKCTFLNITPLPPFQTNFPT